jgi:hypothetical protein
MRIFPASSNRYGQHHSHALKDGQGVSCLVCKSDQCGYVCATLGTLDTGTTFPAFTQSTPRCCVPLNAPAETFPEVALALISDPRRFRVIASNWHLFCFVNRSALARSAAGKARTVERREHHFAVVWGGQAHADKSLCRALSQAMPALWAGGACTGRRRGIPFW